MNLLENLDNVQKLALFEQAKEALVSELIPSLLRVGINPSTFDVNNATVVLETVEPTDQTRLMKLSEGLVIAQEAISSLS